ncbi:glycosyltransferase family 2 protein [Phenylobacterium soli]|uniref:Glycosyl transferase family A n=1 Tax=Phenylobacterium soli TaxID=2170551 RepID=A0A328AJR2_9CAUL|nr:glycosyltransferase family 2 protein [Phenylobacterium soli]RAK53118.1 glycosyl transferase family A [Phenylobacterium soli]
MQVAVLIPAKDAAPTVGRAVGSALTDAATAEVVVIDDGSTDDTADAARRMDDGSGRLRILRQANTGPSGALNRGHAASTAPYVCVLDADDFFLPGRLTRIFQESRTDWDMAADRLLLAREGAEDGPYEHWGGAIPADGLVSFAAFVSGNITDPKRPRTELGYLQPVFRRDFLDAHAIRYDEAVRLGEDYLFYAEALGQGARFEVVRSYGYVAVARANSLSHRHSSSDLHALLQADRRLLQTLELTPEERRVLRRHIHFVRQKWAYHFALDAKAQGDLGAALPRLIRNLDVLGYGVNRTLRARLGRRAPV